MNTRHFWNKVDFSESIKELKEKRELLKCRRNSLNEEIKTNLNIEINPEKKINNNLFFDE